MDIQKTNTEFEWDLYQTKFRESYSTKSGLNDPTYYFVKSLIKKKILNSGMKLLEVGFGDGKSLELYSKLFSKADGADISPKNIEITKNEFNVRKIFNSDFLVLDLVDNPGTDKKFDIILLSHVFEHFNKNEIPLVLANIKSLLTKDGFFVGAVPNQLPFNYRVCPHCHKEFELDGHQVIYSIELLRNTVTQHGFEDILIRDFNFEHKSKDDSFTKKFVRRMYYSASTLMGKPPKGQIEFCFQKNGK